MATVSDLSKKYREFDVPTFKIKIDGSEVSLKDLTIKNVEVHLSTGFEASMCHFEVYEIYDLDERAFKTAQTGKFDLGKTVEIYLGYIETVLVFKGYIESVKAVFSEQDYPHLYIECLDVKGLMMHGIKSTVMNFTNYSEAVNKILGTYGSLAGTKTVDSSTTLKREIQQNKETDYAFLCRLARTVNFEFFVSAGKVYFRKPAYSDTIPTVTLEWGSVLLEFEQERNLAKYVSKVTVKGYDDNEHKVVESTASSSTKVGSGSKKPESLASTLSASKTVIIDYEINTVDEAKDRAEAELNQRSMNFIIGYGRCIGLPEIVPGKFVEIKKLDTSVDNKYYVTKVIHKINNGEYRTEFEAGVNRL